MRRLVLIAAILAASAILWRVWSGSGEADAFLGYVEGELLYIGPVEGERLERLAVEAGSHVEKGAQLFSMATPLLDQQRAEATARIDQMEAQLENLRASLNRPEQIAVLQAAVTRAEAAVKLSTSDYSRKKTLLSHGNATKEAFDQAEMALSRDTAMLEEAKRQVEAARIPGRSQEITGAEAALAQARRQRETIDTRISRQNVFAPAAGIVQDIYLRPGEMVNAAQPVLSLLPPENRKVRFYVPQARLSELALGERVKVSCDGCAADLYGRISFMANREEYTPPVIFSDVERVKLVFKLEARLEGAARELPLGLPVAIRRWPEGQ
jgi:HlyD family secretion protein